jgi:hypothetical protein
MGSPGCKRTAFRATTSVVPPRRLLLLTPGGAEFSSASGPRSAGRVKPTERVLRRARKSTARCWHSGFRFQV